VVLGEVQDPTALARALTPGLDTLVLGAAITADAQREAREPEAILQVNQLALVPLLRAAQAVGVRRVIHLSSAAVYGRAALGVDQVDETTAPQPTGLYGISKFAAEMVAERLAALWGLDLVSLRLSAVFGPWERATGVRDTTSAPFQIGQAIAHGRPALLARPGVRDWVYAPDVAQAVHRVARAPVLQHRVYHVSAPQPWPVLAWGQAWAARHRGAVCRLVQPGEAPTVDLHVALDRAPLSVARLQQELGWTAQFGLDASLAHLAAWAAWAAEQQPPSPLNGAAA
jgi:UDP-glucose 4-epimerase